MFFFCVSDYTIVVGVVKIFVSCTDQKFHLLTVILVRKFFETINSLC